MGLHLGAGCLVSLTSSPVVRLSASLGDGLSAIDAIRSRHLLLDVPFVLAVDRSTRTAPGRKRSDYSIEQTRVTGAETFRCTSMTEPFVPYVMVKLPRSCSQFPRTSHRGTTW